jgi:hypothetical protein
VTASRSNDDGTHARNEYPDVVPNERIDEKSCALAPLDTAPLVIGRRGFADFLGDLCIATDDLNS